jgi:hypothetical protein
MLMTVPKRKLLQNLFVGHVYNIIMVMCLVHIGGTEMFM